MTAYSLPAVYPSEKMVYTPGFLPELRRGRAYSKSGVFDKTLRFALIHGLKCNLPCDQLRHIFSGFNMSDKTNL